MQTNRDFERLNPLPGRVGNLKVTKDITIKRRATAVDTSTGDETIIGVTDTSVARTITLSTDDVVDGRIKMIKDESGAASTNNITIDTEGSETIDGQTDVRINVNYGDLKVYSDGVPYSPSDITISGGTGLTYADAPTNNILITYIPSSVLAIAGTITALSAETEWLRHQNISALTDYDITDATFRDWLNKINHYFYRRILEINPEDYIQESTINVVTGTQSYSLPSDFRDITRYGCGLYLVNDDGNQTDTRLQQMRFGDNTVGFYIQGTTLKLTQDPPQNETYTLR